MSNSPLTDLDELFFLAQMLAGDEDHAVHLAERAVAEIASGSRLEPGLLLTQLYEKGVGKGGQDLMWNRQAQSELLSVVPKLLSSTSPARRLAIYRAFSRTHPDEVEVSTFMVRVRRALEMHNGVSDGSMVTEQDVAKSITIYLDASMAPTPPSLRLDLESKYGSSADPSFGFGGPSETDQTRNKISIPVRIAAGILLILVASAVGTWIAKPSRPAALPEGRQEILKTIDAIKESSEMVFQGSDAQQIERMLMDRVGIRATVPRIQGGSLQGLSVESIGTDISIGVVHYDFEGNQVLVYILDYSTIQAVSSELDFDRAVLNQIAPSGALDVHIMDDRARLTFRYRDDIYVTYTNGIPQELRNQLIFD